MIWMQIKFLIEFKTFVYIEKVELWPRDYSTTVQLDKCAISDQKNVEAWENISSEQHSLFEHTNARVVQQLVSLAIGTRICVRTEIILTMEWPARLYITF